MTALRGAAIFVFDIVKIVVISVAIIVPIRTFIIQPFTVRGASMNPAFESGDYLFINELGYRFQDPQRGDVVIFKPPQNVKQFYIKRIIGMPGDILKIQDGKVWLGEDELSLKPLEEDYARGITAGLVSVTLAEDEYFVLGDNRRASSDSRVWGVLKREDIIGKAWIRAWPVDNFAIIRRPLY